MNSTCGKSLGDTANPPPFLRRFISGSVKVLDERFLTHLSLMFSSSLLVSSSAQSSSYAIVSSSSFPWSISSSSGLLSVSSSSLFSSLSSFIVVLSSPSWTLFWFSVGTSLPCCVFMSISTLFTFCVRFSVRFDTFCGARASLPYLRVRYFRFCLSCDFSYSFFLLASLTWLSSPCRLLGMLSSSSFSVSSFLFFSISFLFIISLIRTFISAFSAFLTILFASLPSTSVFSFIPFGVMSVCLHCR